MVAAVAAWRCHAESGLERAPAAKRRLLNPDGG
jgi:hypothetical protein